MAGDQARVASAWIDIKARKAFQREDLRRWGHEAGREFEKGFQAEQGKSLASRRAQRAAQGKQLGGQLGDPAGREAGTRISAGITDALARTRGQRRRDGDDVGRALGAAAGLRAGKEISAALSRHLKASHDAARKDGAALGAALGAAVADRAAALAGAAISRAVQAETQIRALESAAEIRSAAATLRARERAAAAAARIAAQQAKAEAAAIKARAREETAAAKASAAATRIRAQAESKADAEAEKAQVARVARIRKFLAGASSGLGKTLLGGAGLGGLASSAASLGAVLAGTVGAIGQLSGAVALLPGLAAGAGVAFAALKIGVSGVGDALKNSSDPKKYGEALKQLSPAARAFTQAVVGLKPELKGLRDEVQDGLFQGLAAQITSLGGRFIPILSRGLSEVSAGFNVAAQDVGRFLDQSGSARQVAGIFDDIGAATRRLAPAAAPAVQALLDLVGAGTTRLPGFSEAISDASARFRDFVRASRDSGALDRFIDGGIEGFKDLGRVVGNTGRILSGVLGAGGGPNTGALSGLADTLGRVADQIARPEFQAGLGRFFESFRTAGDAVSGALPAVADALIALEPAASRLVAGSGKLLASTLEAMSTAATALAPTLNVLAAGFEAVAPFAGALVVALIGVKVALAGLKVASGVVGALAAVRGQIETVGSAADASRERVGRFGGALGAAGKAGAAFGAVLVAQQVFAQFSDGADASTVKIGALTEALKQFQAGADTGAVAGLGTNFSDLGKQLREAADPSFLRSVEDNLGKVQSKLVGLFTGGASDGSGDGGFFTFGEVGVSADGGKQATALAKQLRETDAYLTSLVEGGSGKAATDLFDRLNQAAVAGGAGVGVLASRLPQFQAALAGAGSQAGSATGQVGGLSMSLDELARSTAEYASKALAANGSLRGYESALDAATSAAQRNGETLDVTTEKGRANSEALDQIASSGLAYANQIRENGGSEQAFQQALGRTRGDLERAAQRFGLGKSAAQRYATSILGIPKRATTSIQQFGIQNAITSAATLADRLSRIPRTVISQVRTEYLDVFASEVQRDRATANRAPRADGLADGGLIDRALGSPRQDNVPAWLSAGEFVVNARAVAAPGVESLLRRINTSNAIPRFADGGTVMRASTGLGDLRAARPAPAPAPAPGPTGGVTRDDLEYLVGRLERAIRQQQIVLSDGTIAGAVIREGGRTW